MIVVAPARARRQPRSLTRRRDEVADLVMGRCDAAGGPIAVSVAATEVAGALRLPRALAIAELDAVVADGRISRASIRGQTVVCPTLGASLPR